MTQGEQDQLLIALHAQGLLNGPLAAELGVSVATLKRRKHALGLGPNCPRNQLGALGERLFAQEACAHGCPAQPAGGHRHPFDLQVGGLRVDVKTAVESGGSWRFRLPEWRTSQSGPATHKDYTRDCDLLALVGLNSSHQLAFIQFRRPAPGLTHVRIAWPDARSDWTPLDQLFKEQQVAA